MKYDVLVVGGGPAGSWASIKLAERGFRVLLLEKGGKHRYKVCSGGTPLRTLSLLNFEVPNELLEREVHEVNIYGPDGGVLRGHTGRVLGYTVDRAKFDQWLRDRAEDSGVEVIYNAYAFDFRSSGRSMTVRASVDGLSRRFEGSLMIGAFGASPSLLRRLGVRPPDYLLSVQLEMEGDEDAITSDIGNSLNFYVDSRFSGSSYSFLFPKRRYVSVGITERASRGSLVAKLHELIRSHPVVSRQVKRLKVRRLPGGREVLAHLNPNSTAERTYGDNWVLVGDAAGFADPITWEGIYYAISSAEIAVKIVPRLFEVGNFTSRWTRLYQYEWMREYGYFRMEYLIRDLLWTGDIDAKWRFLIRFFNSDPRLKSIINWGLSIHMSMAPVIMRLSFIEKFRIGWRLGGYKLITTPERWLEMLSILFGVGEKARIEEISEEAYKRFEQLSLKTRHR